MDTPEISLDKWLFMKEMSSPEYKMILYVLDKGSMTEEAIDKALNGHYHGQLMDLRHDQLIEYDSKYEPYKRYEKRGFRITEHGRRLLNGQTMGSDAATSQTLFQAKRVVAFNGLTEAT